MCASSLGALYIYRRALLCELKDTEERNPCVWEVMVVVWCCLSVTVVRSPIPDHALLSLPLVWGASLGTVFTSAGVLFTSVSGALLLSSTMILPLGEREKRSLSAVYFSPLFGCFYSLYYFQESAVLTVQLWFIHPHVLSNLVQSWRAGVLQSLAPTLIKHLKQQIKVLLSIPWNFQAGVLRHVGAKLCRTSALQDKVWWPLC